MRADERLVSQPAWTSQPSSLAAKQRIASTNKTTTAVNAIPPSSSMPSTKTQSPPAYRPTDTKQGIRERGIFQAQDSRHDLRPTHKPKSVASFGRRTPIQRPAPVANAGRRGQSATHQTGVRQKGGVRGAGSENRSRCVAAQQPPAVGAHAPCCGRRGPGRGGQLRHEHRSLLLGGDLGGSPT